MASLLFKSLDTMGFINSDAFNQVISLAIYGICAGKKYSNQIYILAWNRT